MTYGYQFIDKHQFRLSESQSEVIRFALGQSENTHDLTTAQYKALTAIQYTVAVRDKMIDAYKEIMNMQI